MHRERVERHCKGVTTSLNEFKARFQQMVEEHDKEVRMTADNQTLNWSIYFKTLIRNALTTAIYVKVLYRVLYCPIGGARVAHRWEHSPPISVVQVQNSASPPHVGLVFCWFSHFLGEFFLRVLRFPLSWKTNISKFQFDQGSGRRRCATSKS